MKNKKLQLIQFLAIFLLFLSERIHAQIQFDLESGVLLTGYNHVRIPGSSGTMFSLNRDLKTTPTPFYRLRANYALKSRHYFSVLYAPLSTVSKGVVENDINFTGTVFEAGGELRGEYKFNSYRLTYRYDFLIRSKITFGLGLTAKIRDARIGLSNSTFSAEKTDFGFVPIINFRLLWAFKDNFDLLFEGDALFANPGRAADVTLTLRYQLNPRIHLRGGYRILEGGADNARVYNFSLFHYAALGISYSFVKEKGE
jgi:hypothetical protein